MDLTILFATLEDAQARLDLLQADRQSAIDAATPPEVRAAWAEIEEEYAPALEMAAAQVAAAADKVKAAVADHGATVKGRFLQAVWSKPRVVWDAKALDGYAIAHPELFAFRKEGAPSVSIRSMK